MGWSIAYHMKKLALLFAGQGAQYSGMGLQVLTQSPYMNDYFNVLQSHVDFSLSTILSATDGSLNQTKYTQPSVLSTSLLLYTQLQHELSLKPDYVAGFSLGEFTALHVAGYLDLPSTLSLIQLRADTMNDLSSVKPGAMAAVIGGTIDQVESLCRFVTSNPSSLTIANYNCPGQVVISGDVVSIDKAIEQASQFGIRRAIKLQVSGAFHSEAMKDASLPIQAFLHQHPLQKPTIPMLFNVTGDEVQEDLVNSSIVKQVYSPVYFQKTIENLILKGVDTFIEIGPGNVLSGFVKKTKPDVTAFSYNGLDDLSHIKEFIHGPK